MDVRMEASPSINVIHGDNAQGKSNLLEGIDLLCDLNSFRSPKLEELIHFGDDTARVRGVIAQGGLDRQVEVTIRPGNRQVRLDGSLVRSRADFREHFHALTFAAEDLRIVTGSPTSRRSFLDRAICDVTPNLEEIRRSYLRTVSQKGALLGQGSPDGVRAMLPAWNLRQASLGARLIAARVRYLRYIQPAFQRAFERISDMDLSVDLTYESGEIDVTDGEVQISTLEETLLSAMERHEGEELRRGQCLVGPHRHDFIVSLGGRPAGRFASQGQLRMLAMSLKLAELTGVTEQLDVLPVFLLDDVSSELDAHRNRCLMEVLGEVGCQTFITTTSLSNLQLSHDLDNRVFRVERGQLST